VSCNTFKVSALNDNQMTGKASASTLAITGSSMPCGRRWRTRLTLSRTSAAAESASRDNTKLMVIWLCSWRLMEVMTSTPSIPERESSNTLVTCDSTTALDAPVYLVSTVTTGLSILGYSRTFKRVNDTTPTNTMSSDSTVANTGRRMDISGNCM